MPVTISGTTSGTSIRMFAPGAHRVRERTRPIASAVPSMVAATMVSSAISSEANSDSRSSGLSRKALYHSSDSPSIATSDFWPLNENRITTKIGTNRKR